MVGALREELAGGWFDAPRFPEGVAGAPGALPLHGLTLRDRQERAFLQAGVASSAAPPERARRLLVREDVAVTWQAVGALAEAGAAAGKDVAWRLGGRAGALARELCFDRDEPLFVHLVPGGPADLARIAAAEPVAIDPRERMLRVPFPTSTGGPDVLELPLTDRLVLPAGHWVQLLWANLLGMAPFLWEHLVGRNVARMAWNLAAAAIRARSFRPLSIAAHLGRRGSGCRVHPSAVVEGCWLGDGVQIGAHAVLRASVLADGAAVEELAVVEGAVLAPGARVQRLGLCKFSVLREGAVVGGSAQLAVLDRGAALKRTAALLDQGFGQGVRVAVGDRLLPAPMGLAGGCIGAGTLVGAGVFVAPGRALPAGLQVLPDPASVVREIPHGVEGLVVVRGGRLVRP